MDKGHQYTSILAQNPFVPANKSKKVLITGAGGNIGYSLSFMVAQGLLLGSQQPIDLYLLDLPFMRNSLEGLEMELTDAAFSLLNKLVITCNDEEGFKDCEIALLIGAKPRGKGMDRKDLLEANASIFKEQAQLLDKFALEDVKVCVVGNPANTNALIISENTHRIKKFNITALTRLDHNRALAQVASKLSVHPSRVRNVTIWGNHSNTQVPDVTACQLYGQNSNWTNVGLGFSIEWLSNEFIPKVQFRGSEIIGKRQLSSAASAAVAICDHVRNWMNGTQEGEIVSMAVWSNGNPFGIKDGLIFSFPVTCKNGEWSFAPSAALNDETIQKMIDVTTNELSEEKETALRYLTTKANPSE